MHSAEAFLLLSLPNATLKSSTSTYTDCLYLECITIPTSALKSPFPDRDVYLVLRISDVEIAIDPSRTIHSSVQRDTQVYTFHATEQEGQFEISVTSPHNEDSAQDLETFDHILTQYAHFTSHQSIVGFDADAKIDRAPSPIPTANDYEDLRGKLVLINESDGQVVGELDNQFNIREDPALTHGLGPHDNVVLELPPDYEIGAPHTGGSRAREAFVHAVPSAERDLLTNTASLVRYVIRSKPGIQADCTII
jgi:spartin